MVRDSSISDTPESAGQSRGRPSKYPRVRQQIAGMLNSSRLGPGDAIDPMEVLCRRFDVSRPLVRRVLNEMANKGIIVSKSGKGYFMAGHSPEGKRKQAAQQPGAIIAALGSTSDDEDWFNEHTMGIVTGMQQAIGASPYRLLWEMLGTTHHAAGEIVKPHLSELRGLAAVPLAGQSVQDYLTAAPEGIPKVIVGRPSGQRQTPCVYVDHHKGLLKAMDYLRGMGHRQIGYIGAANASFPAVQRLKAYEQALGEHGGIAIEEKTPGVEAPLDLARSPRVIGISTDRHEVEQSTAALLERCVDMTALVVGFGPMLGYVLRAIEAKGLRVPEDLSLVSVDDTISSRHYRPGITVVRQPTQQMGELAARMLLRQLDGLTITSPQVVLDCELVLRDSVRPAADYAMKMTV